MENLNWVSISEVKPLTNDLFICYSEDGELSIRRWKTTYFEGEHISNEPKITHYLVIPSLPNKN